MNDYIASTGRHVSSNGFVNYMGGCDITGALARVWADHPGAVVVDGTDDWYANVRHRPEMFARKFGLTLLGKFHTGISGISKSGIVLSPDEFAKLETAYEAEFGYQIRSQVRVHTQHAGEE